jgi:L-arabinose isomerase
MVRDNEPRARVAFVAGGLAAYWGRFPGLLDQLRSTAGTIRERLGKAGAEVEDFGLVSDPAEGASIALRVRKSAPDLIVVYVATYLTSAQLLPIFRDGGAPVLLVSMQPSTSMDHERFGTSEWLAYAGPAALPELCVALERVGRRPRTVTGHLHDERAWDQIERFVAATGVVSSLRTGRFGLLGHLYPGMFDIASNITSGYSAYGGHVEILELDDLRAAVEKVTDRDADARLEQVHQFFDIEPGADLSNIAFQSRVSLALDALVDERDLDTLSYFHFGNGGDIYAQLASAFPIGATLLTSRGIPTATEFELRAAIAMFITGRLGAGGTLTEGQALDFDRGHVELGHNDAVDARITAGRPRLRSLPVFHGKTGGGASVEAGIRPGPVTQFSIAEPADGRLRFIAAEGEAVAGPGLKIGNTTTRIDFGVDPGVWTDAWSQSGSGHHWSMGAGHIADTTATVADLLDLEYVRIQPSPTAHARYGADHPKGIR